MWFNSGSGDAGDQVKHGGEDLEVVEEQGDPPDHGPLQRSAPGQPGEWSQVQAGAGAGGDEDPGSVS